jgi:glycosyltransferase involved in cell wall biosynthesis
VRFSILGDGPLRSDLASQVRGRKLERSVELLSGSPNPLTYYRSLDIYLNTSAHEGLPLSILEAMACAKPVVAPNVGGIPDIVSHGTHGFLIDSSEPQDFSRACMTLVNDMRLRLAMGDNARNRIARHFRDTRMAEAYHDLYLELSRRASAASVGVPKTGRRSPQLRAMDEDRPRPDGLL